MRLRTIAIAGVCAGAAVAGFAVACVLLGGAPVPQARAYLQGIDVARYQGRIDWVAVAGDDVSFAFIKATEGGDYVDPEFARNWQGARRAGVARGAYHFFTLCTPGAVQARHFLATVGDMQGALAPVLDAEHMGPCRSGPTLADPSQEIIDFIEIVELSTGAEPVIYTTREFHDAHLAGQVPAGRFWLRSLWREPDFGPEDWLFWQHSNRGRRRGISGPVDLNAFAGTEADLRALTVLEER